MICMARPKKKYSELTKEEVKFLLNKFKIKTVKDIDKSVMKMLREELKKLKDVRCKGKIIYKLWDVIICVIVASLAGCDTWDEIYLFVKSHYDWFKSFLQMTGGYPTAQSYERIISLIDSDELNELLKSFSAKILVKKFVSTKIYNYDGRINVGSKRKATLFNEKKPGLNCVNCYSNEYGGCIFTKEIDTKSNEIPAIKEMIEGLDLLGIVVTWDALNTQTSNVSAVTNAHGDYVVPVKQNQRDLYEALKLYFDEERQDEIRAGGTDSSYSSMTEKSHGAIIKYEYFQTSDVNWYDRKENWANLQSFGLVKKTITKLERVENTRKNAKKKYIEKEVTTVEYRYYISSLLVDISLFETATRGHWNVENKVHWHLDFTFRQDANTTTNRKALMNLEIIHKFILHLLERVRVRPIYKRYSLKAIRKELSFNIEENFPEFFVNLLLAN